MWPAGTAWSPIRGYVGPEAVDVAGFQAGVSPSVAAQTSQGRCHPVQAPDREVGHGTLWVWCTVLNPAPSPTSRAPTSSSTRTAGCSTSARPSRCGQRINSYFQDPVGLPARTAQMVEQADHVEWMVVDSKSEALLLEHNLIKRHQPRYNVRLEGRQELSVAGGHRERRVATTRRGTGHASEPGSATSAPTPTSTPSGTPSTCCCAPSRCGAARTPSSGDTSVSGALASSTTSTAARDRASARSTERSTTSWSPTSSRS